jgi:hypothetical protein
MSEANYGGIQANNTAYIKSFVYGSPSNLWKVMDYIKLGTIQDTALTPVSVENVYIPGDLYVDGHINNASDMRLKTNITLLDIETTDKLMNLKPLSFKYKTDPLNQLHYGFIADEFENEYPELVQTKPDKNYSKFKSINYMELIPLLVYKIQQMQTEIDELKYIKK